MELWIIQRSRHRRRRRQQQQFDESANRRRIRKHAYACRSQRTKIASRARSVRGCRTVCANEPAQAFVLLLFSYVIKSSGAAATWPRSLSDLRRTHVGRRGSVHEAQPTSRGPFWKRATALRYVFFPSRIPGVPRELTQMYKARHSPTKILQC